MLLVLIGLAISIPIVVWGSTLERIKFKAHIIFAVVFAAIIYPLGRAFGSPPGRAASMALLLSQAGEFGFVLFAQAQAGLLIEPQAASLFGARAWRNTANTARRHQSNVAGHTQSVT